MILSVGERYYLPIRCPLNLNHNSTISIISWNSHADNCRALLTMLYIIIYLYHKLYLKKGKCYVLGFFSSALNWMLGVLRSQDPVTWREDLGPGVPACVSLSCLCPWWSPARGLQNLFSFPVFALFFVVINPWYLHWHLQVNSLGTQEDYFRY